MDLPGELIEYSTIKLECMARELFRRRPDVQLAAPIDVELLIESHGDLVLELKSGLRNRGIEGCVLKKHGTREAFVWIDANIYQGAWCDYNAVLGEEYAHVLLHQNLLLKVQTVEDFIELQCHPEWHRFERDARRFSLMFRMPADLFVSEAERFYRIAVNENGFSDPITICKVVRNLLAGRFQVSPEDSHRRMMDAACNLEWRILVSVQLASNALVPSGTAISPKHIQKRMFDRQP